MADARKGKRFPVELPIHLRLWDSETEQAGITANVSASGVYLHADPSAGGAVQWRPGTTVEFNITLPAEVISSPKDVQIHCRGRVVRVEKVQDEQQGEGVACVIDKYEFVRNG
jgi:hypothetical protein